MSTRSLLAAAAVTLGLTLLPGTAQAETTCGTTEALEQVAPAGRFDGTTMERTGNGLDSFTLDDEAHVLSFSASPGVVIHRVIVQAGREEFVFDAPTETIALATTREVASVTFCGVLDETTQDASVTDGDEGAVEIGEASIVMISEAVVIERPEPVAATPDVNEAIVTEPVVTEPVVAAQPVLAAPLATPVAIEPVAAAQSVVATPVAAPPVAPASVTEAAPIIRSRDLNPVAPARVSQKATPALEVLAIAPIAATLAAPAPEITPLPVGTLEFTLLTCLGMITFSSTSRLGRRR